MREDSPFLPAAADNARALKSLRESESRYRRLFETARDGILLLNAESGQIEDVNPYLIEMLGYSHTEFLGKKLWEVGTFADIPQSKEMFHELQAKGYVRYDDLPLKSKAGVRVQVEFVSNSYDCEGTKVIQCNIRNITERKSAEGAILREKNFTHAALESLPGLFYLIDDQGRFLRWNRNLEAISGYSFEELSRLAPTDLFAGAEKGIVAEKIRQVFLTGESAVEADIVAKDRTRTPYFFTGTLVQLDRKPCLIGMGIDISARRRADHELQRFRMAMDVSPDSVYLTDPASMRFVYLNDTACRRLGYSRERLLQMGPQDVLPIPREQIVRDYADVIAAGDQGLIHDHPFQRSDGSDGWSELHRRALRADGETLIVTIGRDVTDRKHADARIRRLNRVYAVLSGINSAIVRIRDREELFREACRIAVSAGEFVLARVIELDSNGIARVAASSESGSPLFQQILDEYNADPEHAQSFLAQALRSKQPLISNDVANDPRIPRRAALSRDGNYALAVLPIIVDQRLVGVFLLRAKDAGMFDEEELRLLLEMVSDMAFALDHIAKEERLNYLAMYDPLTGLANRVLFLERLDQFIHAASPTGSKLALVIVDIERLRTVNDSLGRQAGDAVIAQLAERLAAEAGKSEVARVGADHFAIVLQAIKGRSEVTRRIDRLWRSCLAAPFLVLGEELRMAAKAGVALCPNDGSAAELLLRNAEAALVKAKELGERYVFYTPALTARTGERLTLENRLRQALERNEFVLHYQPKVELAGRRIIGVEALIRWQSPELGLVPPGNFIPLMEETGLILDVGAWALDQAIADHLRWVKLGVPAVRVAVNVSAIQLRRRDFVPTVAEALQRGAVTPGIDLEITETLVMEDIETNMRKLKEVRKLGLSIAIDDFGTGYSSLGYLARLPVQSLKIDRSFVITMLKDPDTMTLVSTIISLAHSLRLSVVAEGVDDEDQAKLLKLLRCDQMQGYLFSRPLPFDQMTALLAHRMVGGTGIEPVAPAV